MPRKKNFTPDELMQLAVEEGRLSIHDDHTDKPDPFVGATITTADGEILGKANRCELRVGEHCEYTLIERKLVNRDLKECVLYVTLEPCTDSSRSTHKRGCSTHIVRARLGKGVVSNSQYAAQMGLSPKAAQRQLNKLVEYGVVSKQGEKRGTKFRAVRRGA